MRLGVAVEGTIISAHFGHCEGFQVFEIEDKEIKDSKFVQNPGHRPGFLPVFLKEQGVDVIVAGGMGRAAVDLFNQNNINVITGASGGATEAAKAYIKGELLSTGDVCNH